MDTKRKAGRPKVLVKKPHKTRMVCIAMRLHGMLNELRGDSLSYSKVIEYLLVRSGHLPPEECSLNYPLVEKTINNNLD
jgi:hypothetical protein